MQGRTYPFIQPGPRLPADQKNSGFNQVFKTRLYLNLRSHIICSKMNKGQKDGPIKNLVVTVPKYNSGTKKPKAKYMTFSWSKLAS